jgi:hypothetical protein
MNIELKRNTKKNYLKIFKHTNSENVIWRKIRLSDHHIKREFIYKDKQVIPYQTPITKNSPLNVMY